MKRGLRQRFPRSLESGAKGQLVTLEELLAQRLRSHLKIIKVVVVNEHGFGVARNIRRLSVGPVRIDLRSLEKPFPGVQVLHRYAGSLREAVKDGLVDIHDLRGFCHGEDDQAVVDDPLFHEIRQEGG